MSESKRLKLLEMVNNDVNDVIVNQVLEIFLGTFVPYFEKTETGKAVKAKLTEEEFMRFINGYTTTFLSSLFISAASSVEEYKQRLKVVTDINKDVLVSVEEKEVC